MARIVHIIGNGDHSLLYNEKPRKGLKLGCNRIGFNVPDKFASVIVDYKFMQAMTKGTIVLPGQWILGFRPRHWMDMNPGYFMKVSHQVKEFYLHLPKYVANYTDFNCGHMATHYSANKLKADEIHMYGFDSIFDFNLNSISDFDLQSDRGSTNNHRLADNWRPVWQNMFREFPDCKFILHHSHDKLKINIEDNVDVVTYKKENREKVKPDFDNITEPERNVTT